MKEHAAAIEGLHKHAEVATKKALHASLQELKKYGKEAVKEYHKIEHEKNHIVHQAEKARQKIHDEGAKISNAITKASHMIDVKTIQDGYKTAQDVMSGALLARKAAQLQAAIEHKIVAEKENVVDTYKMATSAFSSLAGIPFIGPALGAAAAAAAIAAGVANGIAIASSGFANGTDNAPSGMAWVGERGPELVNFRGGEQVFTNSQSRDMANQTSYGDTNSSTVNYSFHYSPSINGGNTGIDGMLAADKERWGRFIDRQLVAKGYARGR